MNRIVLLVFTYLQHRRRFFGWLRSMKIDFSGVGTAEKKGCQTVEQK